MSSIEAGDWSECEAHIERFERAWAAGERPRLTAFLAPGRPWAGHLLIELAHIDLELRLKAGEAARVEDYVRDHPELAEERHALLGLIGTEYEQRRRLEGAVDPDEYRRRFPEFGGEMRGHFTPADLDTLSIRRKARSTRPAAWPAVPGYEVVEQLGRGGMGVVYKAREDSLGRHVAMKFLPAELAHDPARLERFRHEARTASALNHPHICTVHALGEHQGHPFIVMELIDGVTLLTVAGRRPPVGEAARLIAQAAQALAAAHEAGVVHRDIKPENIMARADGYVKVLDFGLARRPPSVTRPGHDTDPGAMMGTVAYMSPEQARGQPAVPASDVFSLGIVLYQLLTGRHPFEAESALGYLHAIGTARPVTPSRVNPEVPAALDGLVEAMLNKEAALRPTASEVAAALAGPGGRPAPAQPARAVVRRERELAVLNAALREADAGRGSVVCVAGEPGIGKTTLVEGLLAGLEGPGGSCLVARGHCSERLAGAEAYLPVIEALGDLLRGRAGGAAARLMKAVAPTWYAQAAPAAGEAVRAPSQPAMLREFSALLQEVSRLGTVVLFIDDVHWADVPTVDLLAHVGRACPALRVLVIAAYRPTELLLGPHPFHGVMHEMQARGACTELSLGFLERADVEAYLALAFPGHAFPADFAALIHARTEGNPLFMADLLRYSRERGVIAEAEGRWGLARGLPDLGREMPESVRGLIRRKLERVSEEGRRLLAAAAVQGPEFDSAVVAGALQMAPADVEESLQSLDRVHGLVRLVRQSELPDRTLTLRYAFVHILYQQALDADLPPSRRAALGAALARVLEGHHADAGAEAAAQLACLYEVGRDPGQAARHCARAADNAARVFAHREAAELARRGLRLLEGLPESDERAALELPLQTMLGLQLQVTRGYAAPEATRAYERARGLCRRVPAAPQFPVLWGLWLSAKVRSELPRAIGLAGELNALARRQNDPDLVLQAQQALAVTTLCLGEPASTLRHMEQGCAIYDSERHRTHSHQFGQDPGVACKSFGAVALWLLGHPDEAVRLNADAVRLGHRLSQPNSQALAMHFAAMVHQLRRDGPAARAAAEACAAIAHEHGLSFWMAGAAIVGGWAMAACGQADDGLARLRQGLLDWQATGSGTYKTYFQGLLAEVLASMGRAEEAGRVLDDALEVAGRTSEGLYEAELHRLKGELALSAGAAARAAEAFGQAQALARRQGAKALEQRAGVSLARLGGVRPVVSEPGR